MRGVPQGSILGLIHFNLYVTDMSAFTSSICLHVADSTTQYKRCKAKDIPDYTNNIQNDVENLKAWSDVNSLVFNRTKTKTMIFSTRHESIPLFRQHMYLFSCIKWKWSRKQNLKKR